MAVSRPSVIRQNVPDTTHRSKGIWIEAETGELVDTHVAHEMSGYSGTGYVDGFTSPNSAVRFHVNAKAGIYDVLVHYSAPGDKGIDLEVDGRKSTSTLTKSVNVFTVKSVGKVELSKGENNIIIKRGWGYYQLDAIELVPSGKPLKLKALNLNPVDRQASPETRQLYRQLLSEYGRRTFSGQHSLEDSEYVSRTTGASPSIIGFDYMDYSTTRADHNKPKDVTAAIIKTHKAGHIIGAMWHWNAPMHLIDSTEHPWWSGFYTSATTFDVKYALDNPDSPEYSSLIRDIDIVAAELKKLSDAKIPVLWRPLHEADGAWFWWGAKGPEPFKKLWILMHDRLTNKFGLHNLLWVFNAGADFGWYPGDNYVDIAVSDQGLADLNDPLSSTWETLLKLYDGRKMLALAEVGGVPDVDRMARFGVHWAYFATWVGSEKTVDPNDLTYLYHSKGIINLKDLTRIDKSEPRK